MANTPTQDQLLEKASRSGWTVVSFTPNNETTDGPNDPATGKPTKASKYPEGSETWIIGDGQGHNQTMIVQRSVRGGYAVVEPPKDMPASQAKGGPLTDYQEVTDPNTGKATALYNPKTGDKIDISAPPAAAQATLGQTKDTFEGGRLITWVSDGKGSWTVQKLGTKEVDPTDPRTIANDARVAANQAEANRIAQGHLQIAQDAANKGTISIVDSADGKQMVQTKPDGTVTVLKTFPPGFKIETAQDGTILAIDPTDPSKKFEIYKPTKPSAVINVPETQRDIITQNPDGTFTSTPRPGYTPAAAQRFQELHDGIANIEAMWTRGEITPQEADKYKDLLHQNFDAALKGTNPYQIEQDRQQREQTRMTSGQSLLNQRVASGSGLAESLLGKAIDIVGNKNFMDPSAVEGFSPFQGAADYVTQLGGGQGVYDAATGAVTRGLNGEQQQGGDPASVFLQHALGGGGGAQPINEAVGSGAAGPQGPQGPSALDPTLLPPSPYSSGGLGPVLAPGVGQPQAPTITGSTDPGLELLKHALGGRSSGPQYFA